MTYNAFSGTLNPTQSINEVGLEPGVKERGSYGRWEWWVDRVIRCGRSMNRQDRTNQCLMPRTRAGHDASDSENASQLQWSHIVIVDWHITDVACYVTRSFTVDVLSATILHVTVYSSLIYALFHSPYDCGFRRRLSTLITCFTPNMQKVVCIRNDHWPVLYCDLVNLEVTNKQYNN